MKKLSVLFLLFAMALQVGCASSSGRYKVGLLSSKADEYITNRQVARASKALGIPAKEEAAVLEFVLFRSGSSKDVIPGFAVNVGNLFNNWGKTTLYEKGVYTAASVADAGTYYLLFDQLYKTGEHYGLWAEDEEQVALPYANANDVISAVNANGTQTISLDIQDGAPTPSNIYAVNGSGVQTISITRKPPPPEE